MLNALTKEYLLRQVPSVFTSESAGRTSSKYCHISTANVVDALMEKGFMPTEATQSNCRLADKQAYTKHMLRFRHVDTEPKLNGLFPELVLINSHDGLSSYKLIAGLYRLVCSNGLIAGTNYGEIRIRHQGDVVGEVIEGTYEVIESANRMLEASQKMSHLILNESDKIELAKEAHALRFEEGKTAEAFKPEHLLIPRRSADQKNDLFTVFNLIQENLIKGGVRGYAYDAQGYPKRTRSRAIKSIDQGVYLNRALWALAEKRMS
ncbi:MAG: DUF945 domain-containing protein [Legionellales bacterium]|nr:DUF945 domain-containing protein [Legionellales bacterium]